MRITVKTRNRKFVMPNQQELDRLYDIATAHPKLKPPRDAVGQEIEDRRRAFGFAFIGLGHAVGRAEKKVDTSRAASWWIDLLRQWFTEEGTSVEITLVPFVAAALAHGDILYHPINRLPYDLAFGLEIGTQHPARDAWRGVLARRAVLPPTSPMTSRPLEVEQLQVFGGGGGVGVE